MSFVAKQDITHQIVYEQLFATVNVRARESGIDPRAHRVGAKATMAGRISSVLRVLM